MILNLKRAYNLHHGLQGQKMEYLRNLVFSEDKKTRAKFRPIRVWACNARQALEHERALFDAADKFRLHALGKHILPGYIKTWFSKTHNLEDKTFLKSQVLKDMKQMRTKQQVMKVAQRLVDERKQGEGRIRRIAQNVYDQQRAHLMAVINLERGGTEGGFFPQAGTNLTTPSSALVK